MNNYVTLFLCEYEQTSNWEQKMIVPLTWQLLTLTITLSIIRDVMDGVKTCNNELRVQH